MPLGSGKQALQTDYQLVSVASTAIQVHNGIPVPCRMISVATTGNYTVTNPDGTTMVVVLASGQLHPISTSTALGTPAGTVVYWY